MSSPEAMRYWATLPHTTLEETAAWFQEQYFNTDLGRDEWVIVHEGAVIGSIGIWKQPEFGFILRPDAWGKGFASEAARAFLDYAFAKYPFPAILADVDPRNAGSLNLLGKLGFVVTGTAERTFLLGDEWCDSVYLALQRDQYRKA